MRNRSFQPLFPELLSKGAPSEPTKGAKGVPETIFVLAETPPKMKVNAKEVLDHSRKRKRRTKTWKEQRGEGQPRKREARSEDYNPLSSGVSSFGRYPAHVDLRNVSARRTHGHSRQVLLPILLLAPIVREQCSP